MDGKIKLKHKRARFEQHVVFFQTGEKRVKTKRNRIIEIRIICEERGKQTKKK